MHERWRSRLAIFANIARKYDRLAVAFDEAVPAATEDLLDTVGDQLVYFAKYLTWIAETEPGAFATALPALIICAPSSRT